MKFSARSIGNSLIAAALVLGLNGAATAQTTSSSAVFGAITKTHTLLKGSPAYENVRQFVVGSTNNEVHRSLADPGSSPAWLVVQNTYQLKSATDVARAQDAPGPPVSLPGGEHNPGDTITVSSCGGGNGSMFLQTWGYTWSATGSGQGGGWVLTTYHMDHVMNCPAPTP